MEYIHENCCKCCCSNCWDGGSDDNWKMQTHVHETLGSVQIAERATDPHNHRFVAVSDEVIRVGGRDHVHEIKFRPDFYEGHYHEFKGRTRGAIFVGDGRHVHFLESVTGEADGHRHQFRVATLIDDPIGEEEEDRDCDQDRDRDRDRCRS